MRAKSKFELQYALSLVIMTLVFGGLLLISGTTVRESIGLGAILGVFFMALHGIQRRVRR